MANQKFFILDVIIPCCSTKMEDRLGAILKEYTNCVIDRDGLLAVADRLAKRQEEFYAENKRLKQVPIRLEIDDKGFGGFHSDRFTVGSVYVTFRRIAGEVTGETKELW